MSLKEQLGDANYAELLALVNPPATSNLKAWLLGALKSWTAWFGAFLIAAPDLLPQIMPVAADLFGPDVAKRWMQIIGVIVILLRIKTTQSLTDKAAK